MCGKGLTAEASSSQKLGKGLANCFSTTLSTWTTATSELEPEMPETCRPDTVDPFPHPTSWCLIALNACRIAS
jgi:hypothetical protein